MGIFPARKKRKKQVLRSVRLPKETSKNAGLKHEKLQPGRYAKYYEHRQSTGPPLFFMSLEGERARGSTPGGFLSAWLAKNGVELKSIRRDVPQIRIIPKKDIADYLLGKLPTQEERRETDEMAKANPRAKIVVSNSVRKFLAAIDWAEKTYGIRIDVDPQILEWIEKAG